MSLIHKHIRKINHELPDPSAEHDPSLPRRVMEAIGSTAIRTILLWHPKETNKTVLTIPVRPVQQEVPLLSPPSETDTKSPTRHEENERLVLYELLDFLNAHPELPTDAKERLKSAAIDEAHALIAERLDQSLPSSAFSAIDYPLVREAYELAPTDSLLGEAMNELRLHPPALSDEYKKADDIATATGRPFNDTYRRLVHDVDNRYDETARDLPPSPLPEAKKAESAAERTQASRQKRSRR